MLSMQRQAVLRLGAGIFVLLALSVSGRNLWRRHQRQELINAIQSKDESAVKRLLFRGVPADAGIPHGMTRPIHLAINNQQSSALIHLITFRADLNAPDEQGRPPLFLALATLPDDVIEKMLGMGAAPNATDANKVSCLTRAAFLGRRTAIPLLIAHGAEVNAKDKNGETALRVALQGALATMDIRASPPNAPFAEDHFGAVRALLEAGADPNVTDQYGMTPLMQMATILPREEILRSMPLRPHRPQEVVDCGKLLLNKGAKVNARMQSRIDSEGRTALMLAANLGNIDIVKLLLKYGANPLLRSSSGKTARDYALRSLAKTDRPLPIPPQSRQQRISVPARNLIPEEPTRYDRLVATIALLSK
jgi:ankyrin repeat protein